MKKRWFFIALLILWTALSWGGGYALGQTGCSPAKATLSDETLDLLAETCISASRACPDPCPDIDVHCPPCPDHKPKPPCPQEIEIVPSGAYEARLEGLLLAHEDGYGAGATYRLRPGRWWKPSGVGLVWQRLEGKSASYGPYSIQHCRDRGPKPRCDYFEYGGVAGAPDHSSVGVAVTFPIRLW